MNKNIPHIALISLALSIAIAGLICVLIFDTAFANSTIDYFSFLAALFLIIEGFYKIIRYKKESYLPHQLIRQLRVIIGSCIFTIHVMQYIYGV